MSKGIRAKELEAAAAELGLTIQHDCGGYRVVLETGDGGWHYVFPSSGICPTQSKKACAAFLLGVKWGRWG